MWVSDVITFRSSRESCRWPGGIASHKTCCRYGVSGAIGGVKQLTLGVHAALTEENVPELWKALIFRRRFVARSPRRALYRCRSVSARHGRANLPGRVGLAGVGTAVTVTRLASLVRHGCVVGRRGWLRVGIKLKELQRVLLDKPESKRR